MKYNELSARVIGAAIAVHRELGPGLLEDVYQRCLPINFNSLKLIDGLERIMNGYLEENE